MANEQNLKPIKQTNEEATKNGRKGGIASGKARRERKTFRELALAVLDTIVTAKKDGEDVQVTAKEAIMLVQLKKALKGDQKAVELLTKHVGEMPAEKIAVEGEMHNTLEVHILDGKDVHPTADDE